MTGLTVFIKNSLLKSKLLFSHRAFFSNGTNTLREYGVSSFCNRTHHCGELTSAHAGSSVKICGWLQYVRMSGSFITLRDSYGVTQIYVPDHIKDEESVGINQSFSRESVLSVEGTVVIRPTEQLNPNMSTGQIEIHASNIELLNTCSKELPFRIHNWNKAKEPLRMKYRYYDLRNSYIQNILRHRSNFIHAIRKYLLDEQHFIEVETPLLFKRTPGGAQEFIVPTENKDLFYALPQSPQQFKQLLMVGAIDRYMQIAKCFRDEGGKPDRQPEFTQLDIEMSFVESQNIKNLIEDILINVWPNDLLPFEYPFPTLSFDEALDKYGSDKPDTTFDMLLQDVTHLMKGSKFYHLKHASRAHPECCVKAVVFPGIANNLSCRDIDKLKVTVTQKHSNVWWHINRIKEDGSLSWDMENIIGEDVVDQLKKELNLKGNDLLLLSSGVHVDACLTIGRLRIEVADYLKKLMVDVRRTTFNFLWVENFPLFSKVEDGFTALESTHHPFTAPHPDDVDLLYSEPEKVRGLHYDLVLNGNEIGGGSIRIHNSNIQRYIINDILKMKDYGGMEYFLQALDLGCPPHGGIALGLDRIFSIIFNTNSIRDVIAFPKTSEGFDLMCDSPSTILKQDRIKYHIKKSKQQ